jgi:hypothetical protein
MCACVSAHALRCTLNTRNMHLGDAHTSLSTKYPVAPPHPHPHPPVPPPPPITLDHAVPLLAGTIPGLCISRAAVGLGEGVAPSSATDIVARVIAPGERSRAISFGGLVGGWVGRGRGRGGEGGGQGRGGERVAWPAMCWRVRDGVHACPLFVCGHGCLACLGCVQCLARCRWAACWASQLGLPSFSAWGGRRCSSLLGLQVCDG